MGNVQFSGSKHTILLNGSQIQGTIKPLKNELSPYESIENLKDNPDGYNTIIVGPRGSSQAFMVLVADNGYSNPEFRKSDIVHIDDQPMQTLWVENEGYRPWGRMLGTAGGAVGGAFAMRAATPFFQTVAPAPLKPFIPVASLIGGAILGGLLGRAVGQTVGPMLPTSSRTNEVFSNNLSDYK